jgi:hypothetical protein
MRRNIHIFWAVFVCITGIYYRKVAHPSMQQQWLLSVNSPRLGLSHDVFQLLMACICMLSAAEAIEPLCDIALLVQDYKRACSIPLAKAPAKSRSASSKDPKKVHNS